MKIEQNKFVSVSYELKVGDEQAITEQATAETPLEFIFGTNSMLPGFETKLEGLKQGNSFEFILEGDDAYGEYDEEYVVDLPKDLFLDKEGVFNEEFIYVGNVVPMMDSNGNRLQGTVLNITDGEVRVDFNHPYAGNTLNFSGTVLEVREATAEELVALMAGDGCGCGSSCGCGGSSEEDDIQSGGCGSGCSCGSGGCH